VPQVDLGVKGLSAAAGLGGFLPLLGPGGERLGLDTYGRLLVMPGKQVLTGGPVYSVSPELALLGMYLRL
jgi:hypothetical protein